MAEEVQGRVAKEQQAYEDAKELFENEDRMKKDRDDEEKATKALAEKKAAA